MSITDGEAKTQLLDELKIQDLMQYLPHRYPFLMVDRIKNIKGDSFGIGIKNISINEYYFVGHFPSKPVMPGVLIIEGMAQTAGAICLFANKASAPELVYFLTIEKAKFRKPAEPGDCLEYHMTKTANRRNIYWFSGVAKIGDTVICEAEISAMVAPSAK